MSIDTANEQPQRQNVTGEIYRLADRMVDTLNDMPDDDLTPGFRLLNESRTELHKAFSLLLTAAQLVQQALDRETPRYDAYDEAHEALMPKSNVVPIRGGQGSPK
jgi:hypothetical protein